MTAYMTMSEVEERFRRSRRTIFRWIKSGKFPRPVLPGEGGAESLFLQTDIEEFERSLIEASRQKAA